jgi:hypothetical protein
MDDEVEVALVEEAGPGGDPFVSFGEEDEPTDDEVLAQLRGESLSKSPTLSTADRPSLFPEPEDSSFDDFDLDRGEADAPQVDGVAGVYDDIGTPVRASDPDGDGALAEVDDDVAQELDSLVRELRGTPVEEDAPVDAEPLVLGFDDTEAPLRESRRTVAATPGRPIPAEERRVPWWVWLIVLLTILLVVLVVYYALVFMGLAVAF